MRWFCLTLTLLGCISSIVLVALGHPLDSEVSYTYIGLTAIYGTWFWIRSGPGRD
jgi:hypothetical protein